jgi:uncharacterized membrane protein
MTDNRAAGSVMAGAPPRKPRIESVDVVRGVIMIVMALDHCHDFFGDLSANATNLTATTAALFFTRWITHICAPTFFLLTGVSASLTRERMDKNELARFLLARGFWLIFLELTVMRFALQFNVDYHVTILTVLWGLGWAMIVLAGLLWLPLRAIAAIAVVMIALHNLLDGVDPASLGAWGPLWSILHSPGIVYNDGSHLVLVSYVLIPWVGVTALGYVLGESFRWNPERRVTLFCCLGFAFVVLFIGLRALNVYGDPGRWSHQHSLLWTAMSFVNTVKYPPSLLFLLMTLGPTLLMLGAFEIGVPALFRPALVIGKVPLFFYIAHFYLIHLLAVAASGIRFGRVDEMFRSPDLAHFPFTAPPGWDLGLPFVYLVWAVVVVSLYPLCRWYAGVKRRRTDWWLSYV